MKMRQFPLGLYQKWLSEYAEKHPNLDDPWHKYQYLKSRAQAYLNSQETQKQKKGR